MLLKGLICHLLGIRVVPSQLSGKVAQASTRVSQVKLGGGQSFRETTIPVKIVKMILVAILTRIILKEEMNTPSLS